MSKSVLRHVSTGFQNPGGMIQYDTEYKEFMLIALVPRTE